MVSLKWLQIRLKIVKQLGMLILKKQSLMIELQFTHDYPGYMTENSS